MEPQRPCSLRLFRNCEYSTNKNTVQGESYTVPAVRLFERKNSKKKFPLWIL